MLQGRDNNLAVPPCLARRPAFILYTITLRSAFRALTVSHRHDLALPRVLLFLIAQYTLTNCKSVVNARKKARTIGADLYLVLYEIILQDR